MKIHTAILALKKHRLHDRVLELKALMAREKNPAVIQDIKSELEATITKLKHVEMREVFSPVENSMLGMANSKRIGLVK